MSVKVLVTGQMRSGTTFLCNFLNSQPNAVVYADFLRTPFEIGMKLGIKDTKAPLGERAKNILFSNLAAEGSILGFDFSEYLTRETVNSWDDFFMKSLEALAPLDGTPNAQLVGLKKTEETQYLKALLEANCKIIYMIRDPRDVLISSKNRFAHYKPFPFLKRWQENLMYAEQFETHPNFMLLKYEDLMLDKDTTLENISAFLNISIQTLENQKLKSKSHDGIYNDNSSFGDIKKLFDPKGVARWKSKMGSEEVILATHAVKSQLQKHHYDIPKEVKNNPILVFKYKIYWQYKKLTGWVRAFLK